MRQIKNKDLAQLLMQLRFTVQKHRQKQLDAAEKLLIMVDEEREYPFEFVCFHITGYHPKNLPEQPLIPGDELAEDLRIFISKLSGRLARPAAEQKEKVFAVEELARELDVSTKTISRWRTRGLLTRKYVFADGKKRFGFLQSAVDTFFEKNPRLVANAKNFGRLTDKEKQLIIKQASLLGAKTALSRHQIISQVAKETGRAHETVRYTILDYEKAYPQKRVFKKPAGVISPTQAGEIYKLYKQGVGIGQLMGRFGRSKSSIYRLINRRRARALLGKRIEFVISDEFLHDDAKEKILGKAIEWKKQAPTQRVEPFELAGEALLPEYVQTFRNTPVLDRELEVDLFRRYNYLKYLACITRAGMNPARVRSSRLKQIEDYLAEAETIKKMIIESNLRLVISVAMKHAGSGKNLSDLVSEGNFSLMRAVETFDYTRGFRFASHASWSIAKDFAREIPPSAARAGKPPAASIENIYRDMRTAATAGVVAVERARQDLIQVIRENLDEREQHVILNHFGLLGSPVKKTKKTLAQIGEDLGVSKERVRQIELVALQKLRHSLSAEQFELLTG